ncbi:orotidine-5'-phosphate decarboxylase [Geosporobacter subterraneus DSM 17957]|uniref:Orotidine 5'-phosphate decarboxylase n=1 Tax=Geosporobacter subterraneus DSM 17957 TaxID=1121919 RepID=A0A1M6LMQ1_9FIRM|nr:orotidine-5'-phosphate decarboxylase [Geosporobacter subterraneus]SHJ72454.1 orotidine-5'-phosphate decarboxylase [Geosporobacter subterraneus DSM 17957]
MFIDRLVRQIKEKRSNVVVGLDPRLEMIPRFIQEKYFQQYGKTLRAVEEILWEFGKEIIDQVWDIVPAIKPQIAFYEQYGIEGMSAYRRICQYGAQKGLLIIGDVKRGDIGTTSKAYAIGHLGKTQVEGEAFEAFSVDAVTVNPYLGDDCLKEFMEDIKEWDRGMFVLVKTSNPSSGQLQDLEAGSKKIYEVVAEMVSAWSSETLGSCGYSSVGAVVGATYPEQGERLRALMPRTYFLVPGYGAQGAKAEDILPCFNEDGLGAIVNSSRDIIFAYAKKDQLWKEDQYGEAARAAALRMREDINNHLVQQGKCYW